MRFTLCPKTCTGTPGTGEARGIWTTEVQTDVNGTQANPATRPPDAVGSPLMRFDTVAVDAESKNEILDYLMPYLYLFVIRLCIDLHGLCKFCFRCLASAGGSDIPFQAFYFSLCGAKSDGGQCKRTLPKGEVGATRGQQSCQLGLTLRNEIFFLLIIDSVCLEFWLQ